MRNTTKWRKNLDLDRQLCEVELALYLLKILLPNAAAKSFWVLMTGYDFSFDENWNDTNYNMLAKARHLLSEYSSPYTWEKALKNYRQFPSNLRGYEVSESLEDFSQRTNITIASNRFQIYENTLTTLVDLEKRGRIKWAEANQKYSCVVKDIKETITIPPAIIQSSPSGHNLTGSRQRKPLNLFLQELIDTGEWMDDRRRETGLIPTWKSRIEQIQLQLFDDRNSLVSLKNTDSFTINGLMHLVGMLSSGKSNFMKVLAVWAYRKKLRVTLVVGDVLQIFELIKTFTEVGITNIAPILGNYSKKSHLNRLHQAVYNSDPDKPFNQNHPAFPFLSNTCLLSGLVTPKMTEPFAIGAQPCYSLIPIDDNSKKEKKSYCPAYSICPYHRKEIDLVKANIWIATPASLIYSKIPHQINAEKINYLELVYRCSDLVIIDEVDQVQAYLDKAFSPAETLRRPSRDAWLDKIVGKVEAHLANTKSRSISNKVVSEWWDACQEAKRVSDRIYNLLGSEKTALSQWRDKKSYFTDWLLLKKVSEDLENESLMKEVFEPYLDNLDNENNALFILTHKNNGREEALKEWVRKNANIELDSNKITEIADRLDFALLVCTLQNKLFFITSRWRQVREELKLQLDDSLWFEVPLTEYKAIIPAMPMGNQLAFQYHKSYKEKLGSLQFFRCTGVGRWLLSDFHELFTGDDIIGPHTIELSGTSWAGNSPAYHLNTPIIAVLSQREVKELKITSELLTLYDNKNRPISISGSGDKKPKKIEEIVTKLVEEEYFEEILKELEGRKILLVVNSYEQVRIVYDRLVYLGWKDKIVALTKDDDLLDWLSEDEQNNVLQRGRVKEFAKRSDKKILIAPLKAIERGHNIVDDRGMAVIGAVYFLVLPHPTPDDISYAIHSINRWAIDNYKNYSGNILEIGESFRQDAYKKWLHLLHLPVVLKSLEAKDLKAVHWDIAVSLWQVIGRLIRGGKDAKIFWCDAKFSINTAKMEGEDTANSSILVGIRDLLEPYFNEDNSEINPRDKQIVRSLYSPFYQAIAKTKNLF